MNLIGSKNFTKDKFDVYQQFSKLALDGKEAVISDFGNCYNLTFNVEDLVYNPNAHSRKLKHYDYDESKWIHLLFYDCYVNTAEKSFKFDIGNPNWRVLPIPSVIHFIIDFGNYVVEITDLKIDLKSEL